MEGLIAKVHGAAEETLARLHYVSPIEVLVAIRRLEPVHVEAWRKGRIEILESMIQGSANFLLEFLNIFLEWVQVKHLRHAEVAYTRVAHDGVKELRFTNDGNPAVEKMLRIHWTRPDLPQREQEKLVERASKPKEPVVFDNIRDSRCSECGVEIPSGSFLWMEANQPLCLACAGRDDLEFLPAGDTALTRRATKYSKRSNVVVRFSKSRGRYERQGILVEPAALEKAEQECTVDAAERAAARARAAVRRTEDDREFVLRLTAEIRKLFPNCPPDEARRIAEHTAVRGSGRVGRSAAGQKLDESALTAAVHAAVRHNQTNYDELLASGADRESARARVLDRVQDIVDSWRE